MSRACRVRSVYGGLSQIQHGMSDIACSVQICTNTFNSTTNTSESTMVSTTQTTARGTELRCHKWIDISYRYANSLCFVRQEAAELGEAPAMHFSFSSCCFADVGQVLQDYLGDVRIDTIRDDLFAYVVVSPSSEPFLSARNDFEKSLRTSSAFSLECATKESVTTIHPVGILGCVESRSVGDCRVAYAEVDTNSCTLLSAGVCFSVECEAEPVMSKFVSHEQSFSDLPKCEVLQIAIGNVDRYCDTRIKSAQRQEEVLSIRIHTSGPVKVVSDRTSIDNRLSFSFLHHTTTLFDAANCDLSGQCFSEFSVDVRMQNDVVLDAECPRSVDAMLQSNFVCCDEFVECSGLWQSNSRSCSQGIVAERVSIFKANDVIQLHRVTSGFLHHLKMVVSSAQNI